MKPFSQAMIQEAKKQPGGWLYELDPLWRNVEIVPPEMIVGAWKINENGELTGEFEKNPNHIPLTSIAGE